MNDILKVSIREFSYPESSKTILSNIELEFKKGEIILLQGSVGSERLHF